MSLFKNAVVNKPEKLLNSDLARRGGRIQHHFYALGVVSVLLIEVKMPSVLVKERLDVIAQVLAECAGMFAFVFSLLQF